MKTSDPGKARRTAARFVIPAFLLMAVALLYFWLHGLDADLDLVNVNPILFYGDESWHSGNAVSKFITGQWTLVRWNHMKLMPVMPLLQYAAFNLLGMSLYTLRLPSALLSLSLIWAGAWLILRREDATRDGRITAPAAMSLAAFLLLLGTNQYFFGHGRIALLDIPMSAFGCLSLLGLGAACSAGDMRRRLAWAGLSGLLLALSIMTKASGVQFLAAMGLFWLLGLLSANRKPGRDALAVAVAMAVGVGLSLAARHLLSGWAVPDQDYLDGLISGKIDLHPDVILANYRRLWSNPFVANNRFLLLASGAGALLALGRGAARRDMRHSDALVLSQFASALAFIGFFGYQPVRYLTVLTMPMAWFAATLPMNAAELVPAAWARRPLARSAMPLLLLAMLVAADAWNLRSFAAYAGQENYVTKFLARDVKRIITEDSGGSPPRPACYGMTTAVLAAENGLGFDNIPQPQNRPIYIFLHYELTADNLATPYRNYFDYSKLHLLAAFSAPNPGSGKAEPEGFLYRQDP